ncbi:MAG: phosphopantetheine-binding protein [Tannerella sp.]|jgi:acyl carrier protein|nr:phosphopantetheine-binding protein [Tannerella sp.]
MERKEIETLVKAFLEEDMEIDAALIVNEALLRDDLGLDSLDFVDIVVIVEKTFGFKIKPEEMAAVQTVDEFCNYIYLKTTAQTAQ